MNKLPYLPFLFLLMLLPFGMEATIVDIQNTSIRTDQKITFMQKMAWKNLYNKIQKKYKGSILEVKGCEKIQLKNSIELNAEIVDFDLVYVVYIACNEEVKESKMQLSLSEVKKILNEDGDIIYNNVIKSTDKKYDIFSAAALVLGILGFFPVLGIPLSLLAIIFGFIAKGKLKDNPAKSKWLKKAQTGIVFGFLGLISSTIFMVWLAANCCG